ncbi:MAG: hypothetical protein MI919_23245 [Holophagales bacterium]|nr:hypothetical protein [Holophagales bacterium]
MQWSKLRKQVLSRFAESVAKRVDLHSTRYRWHHEADGRIWITIDGEEMATFCANRFRQRWYRLVDGMMEHDPHTAAESRYEDPSDAALDLYAQMIDRGERDRRSARAELEEYLDMPFEEALASPSPVHAVLVVLDRRLGKRRLSRYEIPEAFAEMVEPFYRLRLEAEGVRPTRDRSPATQLAAG